MSVNIYDKNTGTLTALASGSQTWVGTKAQHDAARTAGTLPNGALICITDDEVDHNHYSTDEVETGMYWIDGKKIYRKVIETTSPTSANTDAAIYTFNGVDSFINISGYIINTSYTTFNQFMPINWARPGIDTYVTISNDNIKTLSIKQYCSNSGYTNKSEKIIIEYTKTTD